jgi:hypothetical protein
MRARELVRPARNIGIAAMSIYRFVLRKPCGQVEELGTIPLPDDSEAIAFGERVVRDLVKDDPAPYTGTIMDVIEGSRSVSSIDPHKGR